MHRKRSGFSWSFLSVKKWGLKPKPSYEVSWDLVGSCFPFPHNYERLPDWTAPSFKRAWTKAHIHLEDLMIITWQNQAHWPISASMTVCLFLSAFSQYCGLHYTWDV